ncbi:MAG TPA: phosphoribosylamine--glycine ligase, partial [Stenomitos sp.]
AWKLAASPRVAKVYCAPGNAGTETFCTNLPILPNNHAALVAAAQIHKVDLVVIGPSEPLIMGLADRFLAAGFPVFGPGGAQAVIEGSKVFSKAFMRRHGIPTARYEVFEDLASARAHVHDHWPQGGLVVKTDGLADVQSVVVAETPAAALAELERALGAKHYGAAGERIILEERLVGPEASILAFVDGRHFKRLPTAQDHKALYEGNRGPNTEGMGAYAPALGVEPDLEDRITREILAPTLLGLAQEGLGYPGVLFVGIMITDEGPKVLEYNCRFGDPEAQVTLPGLQTDLVEVIEACLAGRLDELDLAFDDACYLCVVGASPGYPGPAEIERRIYGLEAAMRIPQATIFHAHTRRHECGLLTAGGRVLNVVARGSTLHEAQRQAYRAIDRIAFEGGGPHVRRDVGSQATGQHG